MTRANDAQLHCTATGLLVAVLSFGCGTDSTTRIVSELRTGELEVRKKTTADLYATPNTKPEIILALGNGLTSNDADLRRLSALALKQLGPAARPALKHLTEALQDQVASVRVEAAMAILNCDPKEVAPRGIVLAEIRQLNPQVMLEVAELRPAARWALVALRPLLNHRDAPIRELAGRSLSQIESKGSMKRVTP